MCYKTQRMSYKGKIKLWISMHAMQACFRSDSTIKKQKIWILCSHT